MRLAPPELSAAQLLAEWRKAMDAAAASLSSVGDRVEAPRQLLDPISRQLELLQELIARERRVQQDLAGQLLAPFDAVFDLLEASTTTLRMQAEALESAGQALEESARLFKSQAELFERAVSTMREPSDRARAVIGLERRTRQDAQRKPRRRS